jgi:N-acetylglucosamine malate deacetylase 1
MISTYAGKSVLAVAAHPDDTELGAGGTVARLTELGSKVTMVVVCSPNNPKSRFEEARKAAAILGANLEVLYPDREMRVEDVKQYELVAKLDDLVRKYDPAVVLTHAASNFHHDHVLTNKACVAAQRLHFFDLLCFYPTSCHPVTTPFHPTAFVDISGVIDKKMSAINQHTTQFMCKGLTTDHYRAAAAEYGRLAGVEFAEGLEVARLRLG